MNALRTRNIGLLLIWLLHTKHYELVHIYIRHLAHKALNNTKYAYKAPNNTEYAYKALNHTKYAPKAPTNTTRNMHDICAQAAAAEAARAADEATSAAAEH